MRAKFVKYFSMSLLALIGCFPPRAVGQSSVGSPGSRANILSCSLAPCVVPPMQASEGGVEVANAPIAVNPLNPKQLLVGSQDYNCPAPTQVAFHVSSDGGSKWNRYCMAPLITPQGEEFAGGQPLLGYNHNGVAYIAAGYGGGDTDGAVAFQKSSDGVNWSAPAVAIEGSKRVTAAYGWMAVDGNGRSPWVNSIYISAVFINEPDQDENRVVVTHSHDGGATWKQIPVAPVQKAPAEDSFTTLAVGKDGAVYVTWLYCISTFSSCDGGASTVFSKSSDGGNTWLKPVRIATVVPGPGLPNSHVRVYDTPVIGVDNSNGPHAGNLYVVMYSWTGSYMRVGVVRSTDGGKTWSKPVPVAPPSANHDQFFPWLSVSRTGLVGVSWLDRRNDPANVNYQAFAAISRDGGKSFQPNVQLTTAFSNPNNNGFIDNLWMGDYTGNTWAGPNDFVAAWMDSSNGVNMQTMVGGIRLK